MWFLRKSRACIRRQINRFLGLLTRPTRWHAWLGEERGVFLSNDAPKPEWLDTIYAAAVWFSRENDCFGFRFKVEDNREDSITVQLTLPWVVHWVLSFELGDTALAKLRKWTKPDRLIRTELYIDLESLQWAFFAGQRPTTGWEGIVVWEFLLEDIVDGWKKFYKWADLKINGKPVYITETGEIMTMTYTQPASHGFNESAHEMILIPSRTIKRWPRFWKQDEVEEGIDIKVHEPPAIAPTRGSALDRPESVYGLFVRGSIWAKGAAIEIYRNTIRTRREQYLSA